MPVMYYVRKKESPLTLYDAVVFDKEGLEHYLEQGFMLIGEYKIKLRKGDGFLPDSIRERI